MSETSMMNFIYNNVPFKRVELGTEAEKQLGNNIKIFQLDRDGEYLSYESRYIGQIMGFYLN